MEHPSRASVEPPAADQVPDFTPFQNSRCAHYGTPFEEQKGGTPNVPNHFPDLWNLLGLGNCTLSADRKN